MRFTRTALPAVVLTLAWAAGAAAQDERGPVELEADRAELDNAQGVSVYTGDVVLTRDQLRLTGERMEVYANERQELQRVVVTGSPATYTDVPPNGGRQVEAEAPRMEYYVSGPERVRLLQGATVTQGRNRFQGETIVYKPVADRIEADSGESDDRIRIRLYPEDGESGE